MDGSYDLVVTGGGSAGLTASRFAVQLGARVALVEKHRIGGDCTWTGCVPSKTLLKTARVAHQMRTADRYGLSPVSPEVSLGSVMSHVRDVIADIYEEESPEALRAEGVEVFLGEASFLDAHTLAVGDTRLEARHVLIATGARPFVPPVPGLDGVDYLTYESIWDMEVLPGHLVVVGGGPIGCEMAQAFRRLGARVTVVEALDRLLAKDEPEASQLLARKFADEGIDLRLNAPMERAWQDSEGIHLVAGGEALDCDALLVAVGRRPNVDGLRLENAEVEYGPQGVKVNDSLRTNQGHIYAAGDCTGGYQFTHYAGWQAFMAVRNALLPGASRGVVDRVPWATFTDPEVAHAGLTEAEARERYGDAIMTCDWPMERVDRAHTEGEADGFIKLVHRKNGTVLGATVVASQGGEMVHEWIVAMENGLKLSDLTNAIHVYPTYSMANMQVATHIRVEQVLSGALGRILRGLSRFKR